MNTQPMASKRTRSPEADVVAAEAVYRSKPIEDRTSRFVGYFSPTLTPGALQSLPEVRSASHKILAWRKQSNQRSLIGNKAQYTVGHDDDGEKYGGKTVEKVLVSMQVAGACVVARWYGGVMLGPVRFTHMEQCAREAVQKWQGHEAEERGKKQRLDQEAVEKDRLVKGLSERDQSIVVLRTLAAQKESQVKDAIVKGAEALAAVHEAHTGSQSARDEQHVPQRHASGTSPSKAIVMDYAVMPLARLQALDKARDATLAFLLKRIEKADADIAAFQEEPTDKPP